MKSKRVILDTNLWISFLISNNFKAIDKLVKTGEITLIFSNELLEEFIDVVKRPKFKKFFSQKDIKALLELFDEYAELIEVSSDLDLCRDKKDNFLLNLSVDGTADFLITGDNDLLVINEIRNTKIITYSEFIENSVS
ncbi:putative toxin-antitoxin system toxin component, PIN family [Leeuwenhoekiella sp. A16]|uniref:putative toxin-antitoxin system toxin component, PIN family n=1 Tax=unclassified Leeuwenhoekiella TaxID=2615029 RepID=UPI003A802A3F